MASKPTHKEYRPAIAARFLELMRLAIAERRKDVTNVVEFAELIGILPNNIVFIEKGSRYPTLNHVCRLCDIYGFSMDYVMRGVGDKNGSQVKDSVEKRLDRIEKDLKKLLNNNK